MHALEGRRFEDALRAGAARFGCHTYLTEARYRELLNGGRIRQQDLEATLIRDLGDHGDLLLGYLGTRFHLRQAMLRYPLHAAPAAELQWVVEKTDALRRFRPETPEPVRTQTILTPTLARCAAGAPAAQAMVAADSTGRCERYSRDYDGLPNGGRRPRRPVCTCYGNSAARGRWRESIRLSGAIRPRAFTRSDQSISQLVDETLAPLCAPSSTNAGRLEHARSRTWPYPVSRGRTAVRFASIVGKPACSRKRPGCRKGLIAGSIIESLHLMHVDPAQRGQFIAQTCRARIRRNDLADGDPSRPRVRAAPMEAWWNLWYA